jgi:hypothetical protein
MMMLASVLLTAAAVTLQAPAATPPSPPPPLVRAQTQVFVRIIQAAEIRGGVSDAPHQRSVRHDKLGRSEILLQFE